MPRQFVLFLVATQFLTRLPAPALRGFQPSWLSQSARYFPLVGVLVGSLNVGIWWLLGHWLPPTVSVGLMLAASLLITGAFHEDGFADTCDGFGGGTTTERVLAIMKDSRIGAYGAMGIFLMLGLKWTALRRDCRRGVFPLIVIGAHMFSRWCSIGIDLAAALRPNRRGSQGQAVCGQPQCARMDLERSASEYSGWSPSPSPACTETMCSRRRR